MKNLLFSAVAASVMLAAAGCSKDTINDPGRDTQPTDKQATISATTEAQRTSGQTRTSLSGNGIVWQAGDQIQLTDTITGATAVYTLSTGAGTSSGTFTGADIGTGGKWAFYPAANIRKTSNRSISFTLPVVQQYTPDSFGAGMNPMVAVCNADGVLEFKNLCGAIKLQLTGTATIERIALSSFEAMAGPAMVSLGDTGFGHFDYSRFVVLDNINQPLDATTPTPFYIVLPPHSYAAGLTFKITDSEGEEMIVTTTKEFTVTRSAITPLTPIEFKAGLNFPDPQFRAYMTDTFGFVLTADGTDIDVNNQGNKAKFASTTHINCHGKDLYSLKGIEYFTELTYLDCNFNSLTNLDLTHNTKLTYLNTYYTQLTELDLTHNTALTELICNNNSLTELDLTHNTALTALDLTKNTQLTRLSCDENRLQALDIRPLANLNKETADAFTCGNQTSDGQTKQRLRLTLTPEQAKVWTSLWSQNTYNGNDFVNTDVQ